ncbi:MAG: glutamate synthase subunit beta [Lachnospiraceae bacterium]|jgi:glutamate synthase (NADPH/NADH) small chain|nr:glutamate synthase subunit beta [Lachnospiraceae bacterium]MCI1657729.1 glutamate synthase subunit beta [Lachnospiraceae bacterium]
MGKAGGFLEYRRMDNRTEAVQDRITDFSEFHDALNEEKRRQQAARCMDCGVPLCQSALKLKGMVTGCPLHNLIPEWNDAVYRGQNEQALSRLLKTNNFPEFTGRVCPALCEKACICGMNDDPVTVHDNELFIIETAFANGSMKPRIPKIRSGKRVAVVGAGPSGLAAADQLNHRGHSVTVFEREEEIGGLLMFGIPNMKLDKQYIRRRRELMEAEGVVFRTGVDVGNTVSAKELTDSFDAVILCTGVKEPRPFAAKGYEAGMEGVYYAVDFLSEVTRQVVLGQGKSKTNVKSLVKGKHVIVLGGGDTGNDCVGTSIRLGCKSVRQLEIMPKPPEERSADNPWPEWPKTLKTDYGQQEAIQVFGKDPREFTTTIREVKTVRGKLKSAVLVQTAFDKGKLVEVEGTEKEVPCDLILVAAGFVGCQPYTAKAFGTKCTGRGTVETQPDSYMTSKPGVFTAGDMHRGQSLVVWAISEGRACAVETDRYLMGYTDMDK